MTSFLAALLLVSSINYGTAKSDLFFQTGEELNAGQRNSVDRLEQSLMDAAFDLRSGLLEKLALAPERDQICAIYQQEKFRAKNIALRNLLRLACEVRYEALVQNSECLQGMEDSLFPQCERICIREVTNETQSTDIPVVFNSLNERCELNLCVAHCLDAQVRECANIADRQMSEQLRNLYSELAGAQLAWSWTPGSIAELQKTVEVAPASCKRLAQISLSALETSEMRPKFAKNFF